MTRRRSLGIEFVLLGGSTVLVQGARFAFSLVIAGTAPGATLTAWALLVAAMSYAPTLLLGIPNGMNREIPYLTGAGRETEGAAAEATTWLTFGAVGCVIVFAGAMAIIAGLPDGEVVAVVAALLFSIVYQIQQMSLRSRLAFNRASFQQASFGVLTLAAGLLLLVRGSTSFTDAVFAYTLGLMSVCVLGAFVQAPHLKGAAVPVWRRLIHIGFPIMVAGALFTLFVTSDRWVATLLLGAQEAAPYALASLIGSSMIVLPTVISQQTYPRMAIAYGQHHDEDRILAMARNQGAIALALAVPVACVGAAAVIIVIPSLLPEYSDSVWPSVIILFGLAPLAASSGYGNFLTVVGRQWSFLAVGVSSLMIGTAMMAAGAIELGLIGIAIGAAVAYLVYGASLAVVALRTRRTGRPATQ